MTMLSSGTVAGGREFKSVAKDFFATLSQMASVLFALYSSAQLKMAGGWVVKALNFDF